MKQPRLNRRLTLENPTRTPDGAGGFVETWTALGILWAAVQPRTGREDQLGNAAVATVNYRILVRGAPQGHPERPMPQQRFRDGNRVFRIGAVTENDPDGRYLVCFAVEEIAV